MLLNILLVLLGVALILPVFDNIYKENVWKYIKEKLEFEQESNKMREKFKKDKEKKE